MYPEITPDIRVDETVSSPYDPAKVIGFTGRNKRLGHPAVVMKEVAVSSDEIEIPMDVAKPLLKGESELIFLTDETVFAITGEDFSTQGGIKTIGGGDDYVKVGIIREDSDFFRSFDRDLVSISNE